MAAPRVLVLVLAGGAGSRLERLTDVPLSNCLYSGLSDVWIIEQQHPATIEDALGNGRAWDLDRTTGCGCYRRPAVGTAKDGTTGRSTPS